jgi:hypothetical protein
MPAKALIVLPLAVAIVVLLTAARILPACAVGVFDWADACLPTPVAAAADRLDALEARRAALEAEVAALQRRVAALPACQRVAEAPPPPPPVEPAPRPQRPPPPPPPPPEPPRDIDQERWDDRDISLLEGCWDLDSNFETVSSGGQRYPVQSWSMCFDASGNGTQNFRAFRDRIPCSGPVRGAFDPDGRMSIDFVTDAQCQGGGRILRREATCELTPEGRARCSSIRESDGLRQTFVLRRRR